MTELIFIGLLVPEGLLAAALEISDGLSTAPIHPITQPTDVPAVV